MYPLPNNILDFLSRFWLRYIYTLGFRSVEGGPAKIASLMKSVNIGRIIISFLGEYYVRSSHRKWFFRRKVYVIRRANGLIDKIRKNFGKIPPSMHIRSFFFFYV